MNGFKKDFWMGNKEEEGNFRLSQASFQWHRQKVRTEIRRHQLSNLRK